MIKNISLSLIIFLVPTTSFSASTQFFSDKSNTEAQYLNNSPPNIYDKNTNRTYIAFQGESYNPYMTFYDHYTGRWSPIFKVADADESMAADSHGAPAIAKDTSNYWHVFYGSHVGSLLHAKAEKTDDISSFVREETAITPMTYPNPYFFDNGVLWLLYRSGGHTDDWVVSSSTDDGETYSAPTSVLDADSANSWYISSFKSVDSNEIHMFFRWHDENLHSTALVEHQFDMWNLYYIKFDGVNFKNISDEIMTTPITKDYADANCLVSNSGTNISTLSSGYVDSSNNVYACSNEGIGISYTFYSHSWNGSLWVKTDTGVTTDSAFDSCQIYKNGSVLTMYIQTGGTSGAAGTTSLDDKGGWVYKTISNDNGVTWADKTAVKIDDIYDMIIKTAFTVDNEVVLTTRNPDALAHPTQKSYLYGDRGFYSKADSFTGQFINQGVSYR